MLSGSPRHRGGGAVDQAASLGFGYWPVPDNIFAVSDDADPTSIFKLDVGTNVSTGTTVTAKVPGDTDFTFAGLELANVFTANQEIEKASPILTLDDSSGAGTASLLWQISGGTGGSVVYQPSGAFIYKTHNSSGVHRWRNSANDDMMALTSLGKLSIQGWNAFSSPTDYADTFSVLGGSGTPRVQMGSVPSSTTYGGWWGGNVTPSATNYALRADGANYTALNAASGDYVRLGVNDVENVRVNGAEFIVMTTASPTSGDLPVGVEGVTLAHSTSGDWGQLACGHYATAWHAMRYHALQHGFFCSGTQEFTIDGTSAYPNTDATGLTLGDSTHRWGLFSGTTATLKPTAATAAAITIQKGGTNNAALQLGQYTGSADYGAIYFGTVTPGDTNYGIASRNDVTDPRMYYNTVSDSGWHEFRLANSSTTAVCSLGATSAGSTYGALALGTTATPAGGWCLASRFDATDPSVYYNTFNGSGSHVFRVNGTDEWTLSASAFAPATDNANTIGTTSLRPSTSYLRAVNSNIDRHLTLTNQTSSAGASAGTLGNAPAAGDPGYWLKVSINGTNYAIPCWAG